MRPNDGPLSTGEHVVVIDGIDQAYDVAGNGPVCVVHSGGPGINSDYLRMPLLEEHLTMVYLDPIGTGESGLLPSGEYFVKTYAHYLDALLNHLDHPRPVLLGHSHGGMVVLELAMQKSHRIGAVIAYDTAPVYGDELWIEAAQQMAAFASRWPERPEAATAARAWLAGADHPRSDAAAEQRFLADVLPAYFADYRHLPHVDLPPALNITWDPNRDNGSWTGRDRLGHIETPVLIICGDYDFVCPPRWAKEMHAAIPCSELSELHSSGHFGYLEQPQDFCDAVLAFIRGSMNSEIESSS